MAIRKSFPMKFTPKGVVDAWDSSDEFPGACQQLQNLILGQVDPGVLVPRPGVVSLALLAALGMSSPTFISIHQTAGSRIFGMVATSRNAGNDEPFIYDSATNALVTISGITAGNTPASPPNSGTDWSPPTMASVGVFVIVTHPGFNGTGSNFFGVFDLTNPAAPAWSAANTATNPLTAVPTAVANYNNRAYYAVANQVQYSDVLLPKTRTNASQALTVGDSGPINALAGLPMQTTSSGVLAVLTIFKNSQTWQVAGDTTTSNLSENYVSLTIGCISPRTIAQSTLGLYFISNAGPYFIDPFGSLRALTNRLDNLEPDIQTPFQNAITPTRWAGCYTASVYRVCGPTSINGVIGTNDYWFDEHKRRWSGPHSFPYDCASALAGYFILTSVNNPGNLIQSQPTPQLSGVFSDLGTPYPISLTSCNFPRTDDMLTKQVCESQIELGASPGPITYTITAQDEQGNALAQVALTANQPVTGGGIWGATIWGSIAQGGSGLLWTSGANRPPHVYPVNWPNPLNFEKMKINITATATIGLEIGTFYARYQRTGYMTSGNLQS